jgi:hypothetical protein
VKAVQRFKFEWWKCRDGYRIEERAPDPTPVGRGAKRTVAGADDGGTFIVPNSNNWESYQPLDVPAPYRAFANWDDTDEGLRKLAVAYGSMAAKKAAEEDIEWVRVYVAGLRDLVARIDHAEWKAIADGLNKAGESKLGGIGRLGVAFDVIDNKPQFRLQPPTLVDALQSQALFDAAHGIKHKKCRNPECDRWFPATGSDALRVDAEYHDEACRRRHAYLMKKATITKKERRR